MFHHGPIVAIDLDAVGTAGEKDKAFVHHLAMSMLPPILPRLVDVEARWSPEGWPSDQPLPQACVDGMDRLLDAWQGLTLNEGMLAGRLKAEVLTNLEHGLVLDDRWSNGESVDDVVEHLAGLGGTEDEAVFAAAMLAARMAVGGGIIDTRGELRERDEGALLVTKGASLNAIMGALGPTTTRTVSLDLGSMATISRPSSLRWTVARNLRRLPPRLGRCSRGSTTRGPLPHRRGHSRARSALRMTSC